MYEESDAIESMLLDMHLDRLSPEQVDQVRRSLAESPELAAQERILRGVLGPLDAYQVPEPPDALADRVLSRINDETGVIPFEKAASVVPPGSARELSGGPVLSLRELIAIAACITLFVGIFIPGYQKAQRIANRNLCRQQLRLIGQGIDGYARANAGYMPWVGYVPNGSWLATRTRNVRRYSNTRPLYLVFKHGYIRNNDSQTFICPSVPHARPMQAEDFRDFDDFAEPANVSYSLQLMNTPQGRLLERMNKRMVLIADRNPLFDDQGGTHRISPYESVGNSFVHEDGAGQNAIFADGRGGWFTTPTIGVDDDNIYQAGDLVRYEGTETPVSEVDTMLVP